MPAPREYGFSDQLVMSQGQSVSKDIIGILISNIPAAVAAYPAHESNDRNGTDWWVELRTGKHLAIDCKVRSTDWTVRNDPQDDLALETWSVMEKQIVGWTRDQNKRTDYVLFFWGDTGRWCLLSFPMLCRVFETKWREWEWQYKTAQQYTPNAGGGYHSQCVFVPRREVWSEIYRQFGGAPA